MLEVGTGTSRFETIEEGEVVDLTRGSQGGWHIWVSFRVTGLMADNAAITLTRQLASEEEPESVSRVPARFDPEDSEGRRAALGWPSVVVAPECKVGELMRFHAVMELQGREVTSERFFELGPGNFPPPSCETP